jgi:hypothetical protein
MHDVLCCAVMQQFVLTTVRAAANTVRAASGFAL